MILMINTLLMITLIVILTYILLILQIKMTLYLKIMILLTYIVILATLIDLFLEFFLFKLLADIKKQFDEDINNNKQIGLTLINHWRWNNIILNADYDYKDINSNENIFISLFESQNKNHSNSIKSHNSSVHLKNFFLAP